MRYNRKWAVRCKLRCCSDDSANSQKTGATTRGPSQKSVPLSEPLPSLKTICFQNRNVINDRLLYTKLAEEPLRRRRTIKTAHLKKKGATPGGASGHRHRRRDAGASTKIQQRAHLRAHLIIRYLYL